MPKILIAAITVMLTLGACTSSSDEPAPITTQATPTDVDMSEPADAPGEETSSPDPFDDNQDIDYVAADEPSQSDNWPDFRAQALPVSVSTEPGSITVEYDSDGTGDLEWYTDGWTEASLAVEDGSGFPIDVGGERALQLFISGLRYPDIDESYPHLDDEPGGALTGYDVSGPFEGMHSITIGADHDMDYAIQVDKNPLRVTIYYREP